MSGSVRLPDITVALVWVSARRFFAHPYRRILRGGCCGNLAVPNVCAGSRDAIEGSRKLELLSPIRPPIRSGGTPKDEAHSVNY